jgi:hypothetical protein
VQWVLRSGRATVTGCGAVGRLDRLSFALSELRGRASKGTKRPLHPNRLLPTPAFANTKTVAEANCPDIFPTSDVERALAAVATEERKEHPSLAFQAGGR